MAMAVTNGKRGAANRTAFKPASSDGPRPGVPGSDEATQAPFAEGWMNAPSVRAGRAKWVMSARNVAETVRVSDYRSPV
jgi:hypothetical protein